MSLWTFLRRGQHVGEVGRELRNGPVDIFSEGAGLRAGMVSFFSFYCASLLVFENDQPTSYFSAHLEQGHAPSPKGEGWGEVGRKANFYSILLGINPEPTLF